MIAAYLSLARDHAPLLIVGVPLVGAALAMALPQARVSWVVAVLAASATLWLGLDLAAHRLTSEAENVVAREGVALALEGVNAFAAPVLSAVLVLTLLAGGGLTSEFGARRAPWAWALALAIGVGWSGAAFAGDWIGLVLAVEIAWLASVGLIAISGDSERGALNGALRMVTVGGASAALALLGVGLIYRAVGAGGVSLIANANITTPMLATLGVALLVGALSMKAGVAPLQFWSAAAYGRTGRFALLVVSIVGVVGALIALARISAFAMAAPALGAGVSAVLVALGAVSVVVGSVQAVGAANVRRMAAYATTSQAGCILFSLALGSPAGLAAALVQTFALAAGLLALLGGAAVVGGSTISALDGLGRRAPLASVAITAGALSFMGAPLTVGFLGRWRLIEASIGAGWWWAAGAALASSLAAVFYGGRLIERVFFRRATETTESDTDPWRLTLAPVMLVAILAIALGFEPSILLRAAENAASLQFGRGP